MQSTAAPAPTGGAAFAERLRRKARIYAAISGVRVVRPNPDAREVRR